MGAAPGWVLGAGVIGDVFRLEERGRAMGIFLAASEILSTIRNILSDVYQLGLFIGSQYRSFCWRYIFILFALYQAHIINDQV